MPAMRASCRYRFCWLFFTFMLVAHQAAQAQTERSSSNAPQQNQKPVEQSSVIGSQHVPNEAIAMLVVSPAELHQSNQLELFPYEVVRAKMLEEYGFNPSDITSLKVIAGVPGPSGAQFAVVAESSEDVELEPFLNVLNASESPAQVNGRSVYDLREPPDAQLYLIGPRKAVIANQAWLDTVLTTDQGEGALAQLLDKLPQSSGATLVIAITPIRPMISGLVTQQAQNLPRPLQPLGMLPQLVEAVIVNANSANAEITMKISMLCSSEDSAMEVEKILHDSLIFGLDTAAMQGSAATASSNESDAVKQALFAYITRMRAHFEQLLKPVRNGSTVEITIQSGASIATTGVLVGLLLPAVQAAREAARRASAANHFKQILLAMHNYEATYNGFPPAAITDEDGKPLLSWRVALLPFLEEQALYDQFHLDEPWDSEHNLPLVQRMPTTYVDPSAPLEPGMTVFHAIVGEHLGLRADQKIRLSEFTDGLSNSILIAEVNRSEAVPWTQPSDIKIDLDDPAAFMGNSHVGGFHVGIGDGSVRFLSSLIDPKTLKALLTRDGGEVVNIP